MTTRNRGAGNSSDERKDSVMLMRRWEVLKDCGIELGGQTVEERDWGHSRSICVGKVI
jgi:hypothetical protein